MAEASEFWEAVEAKIDELYFAGEHDDERQCPNGACKKRHEIESYGDLCEAAQDCLIKGPDSQRSFLNAIFTSGEDTLLDVALVDCAAGSDRPHAERLLIRRLTKNLGQIKQAKKGSKLKLAVYLARLPCNHYLAEVEKKNRPGQQLDIVKKMKNNCLRAFIDLKRFAHDVHDIDIDIELNVVYFQLPWNSAKTVPYGIDEFKKDRIAVRKWNADEVIGFLKSGLEGKLSLKDEPSKAKLAAFISEEEQRLVRIIQDHHEQVTQSATFTANFILKNFFSCLSVCNLPNP
ncbi:uncharacterized protein LOC141903998 [Tubulanus polymorphus]|uniref:uncharacterized protein LOC141903998 n=1 Tax=Tubulanus polymorphus TaxID=672921 RepID=UPI003DA35146